MSNMEGFLEWKKEYRDEDNFDRIEDHMMADMLLFSCWNFQHDKIDKLEKQNQELRENFRHSQDDVGILLDDIKKLEKQNQELKDVLGSFVEYFSAVANGEYEKNGRSSRIRTYEQSIIDTGRELLGWSI